MKSKKRIFLHCLLIFVITMGLICAISFGVDTLKESRETVNMVSERVLIPGGQSVGIKMNVKGVLVVGLEEIETQDAVVSPGYLAGLQIGDTILSVNGKPVYYADDVQKIVNAGQSQNEPLVLKVLRKSETLTIKVKPVRSYADGSYKLGIWVKEKIAGIGTLSFYDPETGVFAALGHGIYESKTNTLLEAAEGELLHTEVKSIKEGSAGVPGEIRGIFYAGEKPLGSVKTNSSFGVYSVCEDTEAMEGIEPMVMATQDQIEEGPACILTTINGSQVERFEIDIVKVNKQKDVDGKGLELEVTDERLLSYSGGIVQGMSGSPIIQHNRLVGAVTHVFVNNPTKGYGIFAEWMVDCCKELAKEM